MRIYKLNEDVDKNGNLIGYGAKIGRNRTIVFGAFNAKTGLYSVLDASNQGVQGGSQVCFKTLDEFEAFKSKYGNNIELVVKRLGAEVNDLVQVPTEYGNLWMRPEWYSKKPPVDARKLNKTLLTIISNILSKYGINGSSVINTYDNILYNNYLKNTVDEITQTLSAEYDIMITRSEVKSRFARNKLILEVACDFPDDISEDDFNTLSDTVEKAIGLDVHGTFGGYVRAYKVFYFDITQLQKLRDKIKTKVIDDINSMQPLIDDPDIWQTAKDMAIRNFK